MFEKLGNFAIFYNWLCYWNLSVYWVWEVVALTTDIGCLWLQVIAGSFYSDCQSLLRLIWAFSSTEVLYLTRIRLIGFLWGFNSIAVVLWLLIEANTEVEAIIELFHEFLACEMAQSWQDCRKLKIGHDLRWNKHRAILVSVRKV